MTSSNFLEDTAPNLNDVVAPAGGGEGDVESGVMAVAADDDLVVVPPPPSGDLTGPKSVTVVIGEDGQVNVDQEVLRSILDSNQESATVTFVRVGATTGNPEDVQGNHPGGEGDPGLLEDIFNQVLSVPQVGVSPVVGVPVGVSVQGAPDNETTNSDDIFGSGLMVQDEMMMDEDESLNSLPSSIIPSHKQIVNIQLHDENDDASSSPSSNNLNNKKGGNTRRSQRQIDKEMKEEAERIRKENQALMKKESQDAAKIKDSRDYPQLTRGGRPKRDRKVPAHLMTGDYESSLIPSSIPSTLSPPTPTQSQKISQSLKKNPVQRRRISAGKVGPPVEDEEEANEEEEDEDDDDDDDDSGGDWNSEDDPERLWCICNQPHNNRFMICCDSCLDWYHGKCVGITKKMGKDMEATHNDWKCPKCLPTPEEAAEMPPSPATTPVDAKKSPLVVASETKPKVKINESNVKPSAKKTPPSLKDVTSKSEEKKKEKMCFNCSKLPPVENSIFCGNDCVMKHAERAKTLLKKNSSSIKSDTKVLVMEASTNTMLNGPNAPNFSNLEAWLKAHPTFQVIMPTHHPTNKFYGSSSTLSKPRNPVKIIPPHVRKPPIPPSNIAGGSPLKKSPSSKLTNARDKLDSSLSEDFNKTPLSSPKVEGTKRKSVDVFYPKSAPKVRKEYIRKEPSASSIVVTTPPPTPKPVDTKPIRQNTRKGLFDALKTRVQKVDDVKISDDKLKELVNEIEDALYRYYDKMVNPKYKNRYRSLVFNIKDEKNSGLFRKIVTGKIKSKALVAMSPEEMANKELQQWRQKELKNDIEKIKSHELDMIQLGSKFVMKSHKGEIAIENDEIVSNVVKPEKKSEIKLPEEINAEEKITLKNQDIYELNPKTWSHGEHDFEAACDVCNGKKTLEEFINIKVEKEMKEKKSKLKQHSSSSSKDRHRSSGEHKDKDRRRSRDKDRDRHRSRDKDKDRDKYKDQDKYKDRDRHRHRSRDKDRSKEGSSRRHSSSSNHKSSSHKSSSSSSSSSHHKSSSTSSSSKQSPEKAAKKTESIQEIWDKKKLMEPLKPVPKIDKDEEEEQLKKRQKSIEAAEAMIAKAISNPPIVVPEDPITEVTSTVNIQTPPPPPQPVEESTDKPYDPAIVVESDSSANSDNNKTEKDTNVVWFGGLHMPDVADFNVTATSVLGHCDYLNVDLKDNLKIVGRIDKRTVWDYIAKIIETGTKEVMIMRLQPLSKDEKDNYVAFYSYLQQRNRFGVVGDSMVKSVKDCYIIPLGSNEKLPSSLDAVAGYGLEKNRPNVLLCLIVRGKRKRSSKIESDLLNCRRISANTPPLLDDDDIKELVNMSESESKKSLDERLSKLSSKNTKEPEEEEYDPEKNHYPSTSSSSKKSKLKSNPAFSPENSESPSPPPPPPPPASLLASLTPLPTDGPITSTTGGFTEQLAKLTQEIEKQKREIEQSLASSNSNISSKTNYDYDDNGSSNNMPAFCTDMVERSKTSVSNQQRQSTQLSKLSDEDLLAKANEMLGEVEPPPPPPSQSQQHQQHGHQLQSSSSSSSNKLTPWSNNDRSMNIPGLGGETTNASPWIQQPPWEQGNVQNVWSNQGRSDHRDDWNRNNRDNRNSRDFDYRDYNSRRNNWGNNRKGGRGGGGYHHRRRSRSRSPNYSRRDYH